ncbi:MAG: histidine--tRNA ligase, partial [Candidatus Acidiferrum sp.]
MTLITPRTLKGFRDFPPARMIARERLMEQARRVYRSYGFAPIDTPALEYAEILLGKGGDETDRQLFRFADHGGRDVAMRFDLTIPFARFAAQHIAQLGTPFKRYHLGVVWRGENTQKGRYREFMQCDFDTIGTTSNAADIEVALVIHDLMRGLGLERFELRINNRLVLNGLLEELELAERAVPMLRALDKLAKSESRDAIVAEMVDKAGATAAQAERVLALVGLRGTNAELLERLAGDFGANEKVAKGIGQLREFFSVCSDAGVPDERLCLDLSIARGLDYYTGTIYETFLLDMPEIGTVCSGGRY